MRVLDATYKVVEGVDKEVFEQLVSELLSTGWQLHGPTTIIGGQYFQPIVMVKQLPPPTQRVVVPHGAMV